MQKLSFLVADDAGFIRDLVKRALKSQFVQCQIDEAPNGRKAQGLLNRNQYDLVLCDWEMPEMSGLELLGWLRETEKERELAKTPFIMVTSRGDKSHVVKAVEAGVSDYIGKPFSNEQIMKKVLKALSVNHRDLIRSILKGQAAMSKPGGGLGESASLLTSGQATPRPAAAKTISDSASLLTGGKPETAQPGASKPAAGGGKALTKVLVRSSKGQWKGAVRDLNLVEISVDILLDEAPAPILFEQVVIDLQVPDQPSSVARINGFVTQLALREASMDARSVRLGVKFVDDDPEKMEVLSRLVASIRR
ncbi:response regulator [Saccharospirillum impatiens]|uniref:response regulator n=1 Tax=Saccharospirillum impatiens TaxID=169438 RepID=UPI000413E44D|nr:response regulator [Saccharospirillum impatiens]